MGSAVAADPVLDEAQAAIDALEAGKVSDTVDKKPDAELPVEPVADDVAKPVETEAEKETRLRDESGKFAKDYSKVALPKDAVIDAAVLDETVAIAREQGLSVSQTQAVVDLLNSRVNADRTALLAAHQPGGAEWTKQLDAWKAETLADDSLGKTPEERKASVERGASVLKRYAEANPEGAEAMNDFLVTSGLGEHPAAVKFFKWLGESAGERPIVKGNTSDVHLSAVERAYQESGMNP